MKQDFVVYWGNFEMYVRLQKIDFEAACLKDGYAANAINVKLCDSVTDKE